MKILFLQNHWYEWQAPMLFSALAKLNGHKCRLIMYTGSKDCLSEILEFKADLIVFTSITTGNHWDALRMASRIKEKSAIPIIIGGPHCTLYPDIVNNPQIDMVGFGEGEITFISLLDIIMKGGSLSNVPGLWYKGSDGNIKSNDSVFVQNLDELPVIDRDIYYRFKVFRNEMVRCFYASRGCKYKCSFCSVPQITSNNSKCSLLRFRTPQLICNEINSVITQYGMSIAFFQDDCFTQNKNWSIELMNCYKREVGLPFMCKIRAKDIDSKVANTMKKCGCISIGVGIESGDYNVRKNLLNRNETDEEIVYAINLLKELGMKITTFNMFGLPGDTMEQAYKTLELNRSLNVDSAWGLFYKPFPNTPLERKCVSMGLLGPSDSIMSEEGNLYGEILVENPNKDKLENFQRIFLFAVRFPWLARDLFLRQRWIKGFYYILFCLYSFIREIHVWHRSFYISFLVGVLNQIQYIGIFDIKIFKKQSNIPIEKNKFLQ